MKENNINITFLDGTSKEQDKVTSDFLDSVSEEEHERSMSSEFDYLDEKQ